MKKNCDLELLSLFPTSSDSDSDTSVVESTSSGDIQPEKESQKISIFYNGKMCIYSDVTHLQAKTIISMANAEMEKKKQSISSHGSDPKNGSTQFHQNQQQQQQQQLPNPKASMKRSLQSFLQKRKIRLQASSPYHQHSRR